MSKLRVSVAIGTWNRAAMVRQAIQSALEQTRPADEICVSDDASPDNTVDIVTAMASEDSRIKLYVQPKNTGGVPNWNAAIERCTGDVIAWCSDDDRFLPDHLQTSVGYLEANPDVNLVHSGFTESYEDATGPVRITKPPLRSESPVRLTGKDVVWHLIRYYAWPFHPSTLVFRRSFWEKVGPFDPTFDLADTDWFVRAALAGTLVYLPHYSAINRRHRGNWSLRTGSARMHREVDEAMRGVLERMPTIGVGESETRAMKLAWALHHQFRLSRLYLARSRDGDLDVAAQIATELRKSLGALAPPAVEDVFQLGASKLARLIYWVQQFLPGAAERRKETWSPK